MQQKLKNIFKIIEEKEIEKNKKNSGCYTREKK